MQHAIDIPIVALLSVLVSGGMSNKRSRDMLRLAAGFIRETLFSVEGHRESGVLPWREV
jgi:hypothetical protein